MSYAAFQDLLQKRYEPITVAQVLKGAGIGRSHGIQVLKGTRPGPESREAIKRQLLPEEIEALGWTGGRGQTRLTSSGRFEFTATLEYPQAPGVEQIVERFVADMTRLAEFNRSEATTWENAECGTRNAE